MVLKYEISFGRALTQQPKSPIIYGMHLIIEAGGQGSRFAKDVGKPTPYPKHLEMIGERTVLEYSVDGYLSILPIDGITILINPSLKDLYLPILEKIKEEHPDIPVRTLDSTPEMEIEIRPKLIAELFRNDPLVEGRYLVFGYGDTVIRAEDPELIQISFKRGMSDIPRNVRLSGFVNDTSKYEDPILFYIYHPDFARGDIKYEELTPGEINLSRNGIRAVNINRLYDLYEARNLFREYNRNEYREILLSNSKEK